MEASEPRPEQHSRPPELPERTEAAGREKLPLGARLRGWRRRHPVGLIFVVVGLLLLVAAVAFLWWYLVSFESTDNAQIDGHISALSTRVPGTVVAVFVDDNQRVKVGQVLFELDPRDYQVALARAKAELARAQANLEATHPNVPITTATNVAQRSSSSAEVASARAGVAGAERDYQSARARVRAAMATNKKAAADRERYQYLLREHAVPAERYDQVLSSAEASAADLASAQALARAAKNAVAEQQARLAQALSQRGEVQKNAPRQLSIRQADLDAQKAAVQAAQAALAQAQLDLGYTRVTAPVAGIVGERSVEVGQRVQPGQSLLAIVNLDDLWVTANFKETQVRHLAVGQSVRVHVDALARNLEGRVESFSGASGSTFSVLPPENATGNYVKVVQRLPVRIRLRAGQPGMERLRPGMSVEPRVDVR